MPIAQSMTGIKILASFSPRAVPSINVNLNRESRRQTERQRGEKWSGRAEHKKKDKREEIFNYLSTSLSRASFGRFPKKTRHPSRDGISQEH